LVNLRHGPSSPNRIPGAVYHVASCGNARQKIYGYATVSRIIKAIEEIP
jgi:hypothetical protein